MSTKKRITGAVAATLAALALSMASADVASAAITCNKPGAEGQCQGDGHGQANPAGKLPPGQNP